MDFQFLGRVMAGTLALALGCGAPALAQTRAEEIARQQEEKARTAQPDQPNRGERFFEDFEEGKWFVGAPRGWYPMFGSVYPSGGFTPGGGYRHHIGYDSYVDASAMYSIQELQEGAGRWTHAQPRGGPARLVGIHLLD